MRQASPHALLCLAAAPLLLAGCETIRAAPTLGQPTLSPIETKELKKTTAPIDVPMPKAELVTRAPNALWRDGGRTFFNDQRNDQRAARVGDILTVKIAVADSADLSNATNRSRESESNVGVNDLLGLEDEVSRILPGVDTSSLIDAEGSSSMEGDGAVNRRENVDLTVAVMVTQILPNGNFVISGRQEIRVNEEMRVLTVAGLIRPQDISAENAIRHTQIGEARISYGGRGVLSTVQRPGFAQRALDAVSPW